MPPVPTVAVNIPGAEYEVRVEPGSLRSAGRQLRGLLPNAKRAAIVTDSVVGPLYLEAQASALRDAGLDPIEVVIPAGEAHKTLATVQTIYDRLLSAGVDRATPVVALGGGVVGDVAGFVAATVLRGVPFVQVPTTLLAMVDASVGGKTGVNHARGKNLIGAFHQPRAVLIDPTVLTTLPPRELRSGLAECIKHDLIRDADGFARLEREIDRALRLDVEYLTDLIAHNVAIKARVVEADPLERGERAHLNFGHTFGHAIELVSDFTHAHGEAVAMGMVAASRLAMVLGMLDQASVDRICGVITKAGLPSRGAMRPDWVQSILSAMASDKKSTGGKLRFVLPTRIGAVTVRDDVPIDHVRRTIELIFG